MTNPSPSRAVMVVLAYLWPLAIVPLLLGGSDPEVRWHARHGLVLMAAEIVAFGAASLLVGLASLTAPGFGCALSLLFVVGWSVVLIVHLAAILKGLNGSRLMVPGLSHYVDRF
jgi:hypothetical protein